MLRWCFEQRNGIKKEKKGATSTQSVSAIIGVDQISEAV